MRSAYSLRWVAVGVFVLSSTLNNLDRYLLAALAPLILTEFHMNQQGYGLLISAFSIAYAASALAMGWFLDRVGVNRGISAAVSWWSASAMATGLVAGPASLMVCRAALGIGESAGVPSVGKLNGLYLDPPERALGAAMNQIGLSLGLTIAPVWIGIATEYSWRTPFVITGLLGFVWMPIWLAVSKSIPARYASTEYAPKRTGDRAASLSILREKSLLLLIAANILWMGGYSLWSNWTTLYLTHIYHVTLRQSAYYVWIPSLVSIFGGFFGGWLSLSWMKRGLNSVAARRRAVMVSAVGALVTLLLPFAPNAAWATAVISASFFFLLGGSVNIYALPIDLYGAARSGLGIAALTCAFGVLQTVISPIIGYMGDHKLYTLVVWIVTIPLLLSVAALSRLPDAGLEVQ